MDGAGGQRTGEVARGQVNRPVPDGQQAVAVLDRLLYVRLAGLAVVEAEVIRERLGYGYIAAGYRSRTVAYYASNDNTQEPHRYIWPCTNWVTIALNWRELWRTPVH